MKQIFFAVLASLALASSAGALGITIGDTGGGTYNVGDTVTITLTVDVEAGLVANSIFAELNWDDGAVMDFDGTAIQQPLTAFGGVVPWSLFPLISASPQFVYGLSAGNLSEFPTDAEVGTVLATISFLATAPGTTNVSIGNRAGNELVFFGLTSGDVASHSITVVPEPATAAMLVLGLTGLGVAGRRR